MVKVPVARATISESPEGLLITIPAKKNWLVILFLGFWMTGWLFGEGSAIHELLRVHTSSGAPMRPELVIEVRFDQVTGDRLRHGATLLRWRPDKAPQQCTMDQILMEPHGVGGVYAT